jgi:hypothetical protein
MFRKYYWFLLILLPILSCRKKENGFSMTYKRQFTLGIGLDAFSSHNFVFKDIAVDTAVFFLANGSIGSSEITRIEPQSMNLRPIFNGSGDLSIIERVEVWISDPNRPNLTPKIIFFRDDVPLNTSSQLNLVPNGENVRPFLVDGSHFTVRINLRLRSFTERSVDLEWNSAFFAITTK